MSIRFGRSGNGYDSSQVMETADDDWRNITDLAERRRIQNRLAQRNYRRKLRNRLEELERHANGEPPSQSAGSKRPQPSTPGAATTASSSAALNTNRRKRARSHGARSTPDTSSPREDAYEISPLVRGSLSPRSADSVEPTPFSHAKQDGKDGNGNTREAGGLNIYSGDFGPLLVDLRGSKPAPLNTDVGESQLEILALSPQSSYPGLTPASTVSGTSSNASSAVGAWQPNDPANRYYVRPAAVDNLEYPQPSPNYSPSPLSNPNPLHLNPPLSREDFYITVPYRKMFAATMRIGEMLQINPNASCNDDVISEINTCRIPEEAPDFKPTELQCQVPHHPYIDTIPFPAFRDRLIEIAQEGEATNNWDLEYKLCHRMSESWAVWGECPWQAESWEVGEDFAREFWHLLDQQMIRCSNFWRRQRGLKALQPPPQTAKLSARQLSTPKIVASIQPSNKTDVPQVRVMDMDIDEFLAELGTREAEVCARANGGKVLGEVD